MYEQGWGKHPTYIIAYGCDDIQDVTWRYTTNYKGNFVIKCCIFINNLTLFCDHHIEALKRRNKCTEEELLMAIEQLRYQRQKNLSKIRKEYLAKRTLKELVELMTPRCLYYYYS